MKRASSSRALQDFVAGRGKLPHYLNKRPEGLTILILCLLLFALGIALVFVIRQQKSRKWLSNITLGKFKSRPRPRLNEVRQGKSGKLINFGLIFAIGTITASIFLMYLGGQILNGTYATNCMLWLQVEGHFNGAAALPPPKEPIDNLVSLWDGTIGVQQQLKALDPKVTIGDDNPVLQKSLAGYRELKRDMTAKSAELDAIGLGGLDIAKAHDEHLRILSELTEKTYYKDEKYAPYKHGLSRVIPVKVATLIDELANTLEASWASIENLLDKYLGSESYLMHKAKKSVVDARRTIAEIDAAIAALTKQLNAMLPLLQGLIQFSTSLVLILAIGLLAYPIYLCYTLFQLDKRLKDDQFPDKGFRRLWDISFMSAGLMAAASTLLFGVLYLTGAVANDACEAISRGLFIEGDWAMLGDKILKPEPFHDSMTTDMKLVLDTCIRADGDGNLATALHLDGRIADLAGDVEVAKNDVRNTREELLQRKERLARVRVLGFAFQEAVKSQYKDIPPTEHFPLWYNQTMMFTWDFKDYKTEYHNHLPVIVAEQLLPMDPTIALMIMLTKKQFNYPISSYNEAIDHLNNKTTEWLQIAGVPENKIPQYCVETLKGSRYNHPCAKNPAAIYISGDLDNHHVDQLVDAGMGSIEGDPEERERRRTLMRDIRDHEFMANHEITANDVVKCPEGAASCKWNDARLEASDQLLQWETDLVTKTAEAFGFVDKFVDKVVVKEMASLVDDANTITNRANCQFEGTALHLAVQPLCRSAVPGISVAAITCAVVAIFMALMASYVWVWYHYMIDVADHHQDSAEVYYQPAFNPMSTRKEFVSYTGWPVSSNMASKETTPNAGTD